MGISMDVYNFTRAGILPQFFLIKKFFSHYGAILCYPSIRWELKRHSFIRYLKRYGASRFGLGEPER